MNKKKSTVKTRLLRYDSRYRDYLEAWIEQSYKLTLYQCSYCQEMIDTKKPEKKHVTSKGFWDSAHVCPLCKKIVFVKTFPSGKTEVMDSIKIIKNRKETK